MAGVGLVVIALYFFHVNEVALLFGGGLAVMLAMNWRRLRGKALGVSLIPPGGIGGLSQVSIPFSLPVLFLTFLKIGAVLGGDMLLDMARTARCVVAGDARDKLPSVTGCSSVLSTSARRP